MKKLLALILCLAMIFALSACTIPAVNNPDGSDTVAGAAIKVGLDIVEALALTAISLAGAALASATKNKTYLQNISQAMEHVVTIAKITVGELKQSVVDKMKAESKDGKLSEEQIEELKRSLLQLTLQKLDDPTKNLIAAAGADICALIAGAGEDWVGALKVESGLLVSPEIDVLLPRNEAVKQLE